MPELLDSLPEEHNAFRNAVLNELNANREWHKNFGAKIDANTIITIEVSEKTDALQKDTTDATTAMTTAYSY